jgi:hypothetical protein
MKNGVTRRNNPEDTILDYLTILQFSRRLETNGYYTYKLLKYFGPHGDQIYHYHQRMTHFTL